MTEAHADLQQIVAAVAIESPTRYTLEGAARDVPPPADDAVVADIPLVRRLQNEMYSVLYCRWLGGARQSDELADRQLVHALSAANGGHGTWEPGWVIAGVEEDGRLPVRKDGLTLWVSPDQLRNRSQSRRVGTPCRVRVGKELRELSQGFYFAIGDGDERDECDADERLVRLYWHLGRAGAVDFIAVLTQTLNPLRIPFRAKVVNFEAGFPRCDAGVLYFDKRYFARLAAVLPSIHARLQPQLREQVPRFTKLLAPGLGLAEDPETDESFGQQRCRIVTEALWRAFTSGADRLATVCAAFEDLGLVPSRPYLQPGSPDDYGTLEAIAATADPAAPLPSRPAQRSRSHDELRARHKQERKWRKANRRK